MLIIGGLGDQLALFVWGAISEKFFSLGAQYASHVPYQLVFSSQINPLASNQPVLWGFLSFFITLFGANFYNLFVVFTPLLTLLSSMLLFKKNRFCIVYSLIFSFSSFVWIHMGVHPDISQVWLIPLFLYFLLSTDGKVISKKLGIFLSAYLLVSLLISNYIGLFLIILFFLYGVFNIKLFKGHLLVLLLVFMSGLLIFWPHIKINYLEGTPLPDSQGYAVRPLDDFLYFSSRPWYFFIPPAKNPWLGNISQSMVQEVEQTGHFLADDYFPLEHSANYLGIFFLSAVLASTIYFFRYSNLAEKKKVLKMIGIVFVVGLLMLPPYFTVSGVTIWTPGYLVYKFFPMFRVTSRLSIILLILLLVILAKSIDFIVERNPHWQTQIKVFMYLLLVVTLFETFVPVKLEKYSEPPSIYQYMGAQMAPESKFVVYPNDRTREALLWLPVHQQHLLNLRDQTVGDLSTSQFTDNLFTDDGLLKAKELGVEYIVVFKKDFVLEPSLEVVYEDSDAFLYQL